MIKYIQQDKPFYVISDTHFAHTNIIKYCNRPFKNTDEMDELMIKNWNETVKQTDDVYFLGDFILNKKSEIQSYYEKLNGNKTFLLGNHDKQSSLFIPEDMIVMQYKDKEIIMVHKPIEDWEVINTNNAFLLYGHIHEKINTIESAYNCSVEVNNYRPISIDNIL